MLKERGGLSVKPLLFQVTKKDVYRLLSEIEIYGMKK